MDSADETHEDRRDELSAISGIKGEYPQFFLVKNGRTTFHGDWAKFQAAHDNGTIGSVLDDISKKFPQFFDTEEGVIGWGHLSQLGKSSSIKNNNADCHMPENRLLLLFSNNRHFNDQVVAKQLKALDI